MKALISPDEARQIVLQQTPTLSPITKNHDAVPGSVLACSIVAQDDLPPFDNSSMDGYALLSDDTRDASPLNPIALNVLGIVAAGSEIEYSITPKSCVKIMTGAPLPATANAVVMREETDESEVETDRIVRVLAEAKNGQNIRRRGSDVQSGETVIPRGTKIGAAQWAMLASLGCAQVEVFPRPRVGIITTGDEIVGISPELKNGQIRDSNSFALRALAEECGAVVVDSRKIGDNAESLKDAFSEVLQTCDLVVTSGGVSAGDFDVVRDVLPQIADVHFWKIAMKPGKPVMFATKNVENKVIPIFGLPGNPVSVMVAFEQFVRPALCQMQGRSGKRLELSVRVLDAFGSPSGRVEFARALVAKGENGEWTARIASDQGSGRLSTMTNANALLMVPAEVVDVKIGDILMAQMLAF